MKNEKYYIGLDIGTDSVGYAVTDEQYTLCKFKGEPMWGVTLFDEAHPAVERRAFRVARRRLDRRQQRVKLLQELFAKEIGKIDADFYRRIKESYLYPETAEQKVRMFGTYAEQKAYDQKYPTIHHLIKELMESSEEHDVRLVYVACAWLVAHRGHFLSEVDKKNVDQVTDFAIVYRRLSDHITRDGLSLPWKSDVSLLEIQNALKSKLGIQKKAKALAQALFADGKAPKSIGEDVGLEYNYDLMIKLLCGGKVSLADLFGKEEYNSLEEKSVALHMEDEKLASVMGAIGDDADLLVCLKQLYDWAVLKDVLRGETCISGAKVAVYEQHAADLAFLKQFVRKHCHEKYDDIFRSESVKNNYADYIGKTVVAGERKKVKKSNNKEDFCKYLFSIVSQISPEKSEINKYEDMIDRLGRAEFLPKQVDGDNRVIPYQLYWYELNRILENAKAYIPFLSERDDDGITGAEKILSVFEFRIPYYVGPLKENPTEDKRRNHWMVRKAEGKIYPWNFDDKVDRDASEQRFIKRMTNSCTYLPGEDVLPKNSLVYSAFEVLNEINNIKINAKEIPVAVKQALYNGLFMKKAKVTPKQIRDYLLSNGYIESGDLITGLDITVKSSLRPFLQFSNLVRNGFVTYADVERMILHATYSEDRRRYEAWLRKEFSHLPESEVKYIGSLKMKDFGRLSKKLLCGLEGTNKETGETYSLLRAMWETNCNLMQLLSDRFTFADEIEKLTREYYNTHPKTFSERLDELYISNAVKRPIIRTMDILKDIAKVQKSAPERIFVEMARGANEDQKGKRTVTRLQQIQDLYKKVKDEDIRKLQSVLDAWGDSAHNKLQSDKLFLYFIQLGKCLYTGQSIDLESVLAGDGTYNIDHIYPRSFVKDDSVINNKALVTSEANEVKGDKYPIAPAIQGKMRGYWMRLNKLGLISDEKFKRLVRATGFTEEEKYEFINRQLVETRQSSKVVAMLLKDLYPETEIVYVKAGLVSDFRQRFELPKSRAVNELHHAKDAYLNIVCGNVWHSKFSRKFWRPEENYSVKTEIVFTRPVICNGKTVWNGAVDKDRVIEIARKNTAHMTKYSFSRKGGFFDQMPVTATDGLVPRKKNMPTGIYGGYNKTTASFFSLVKFKIAKKQDVMVMPVELLYATQFLEDAEFAEKYAKKIIGEIVNKPVLEVEFLLNKRVLKVNTMLSLNGLRVCITSKSGGGKQLGISVTEAFKTSLEHEAYIKKIESFEAKRKNNTNILFDEKHDAISATQNMDLYSLYIKKFQSAPYQYRPANPIDFLLNGKNVFEKLSPGEQASVLLKIHGLFGRAPTADLSAIEGVALAGAAKISSLLSNWKKNYTDVRIIDRSASGLFETVSENLLDLL